MDVCVVFEIWIVNLECVVGVYECVVFNYDVGVVVGCGVFGVDV